MNRRYFFGLAASALAASSIGLFGRNVFAKVEKKFERIPASSPYSVYGYYGGYGAYGVYGIYGGYRGYGMYGCYGGYGRYGAYGTYGAYGPYGSYGIYGYGPYYGLPIDSILREPSPPKRWKKPSGGVVNIDFEAMTNKIS